MPNKLEELKKRRDQINARIQQVEAREKTSNKKQEDQIKILIGAAVLNEIRTGHKDNSGWLLGVLSKFLVRDREIKSVLGDNGLGSDALLRMMKRDESKQDDRATD